MPKFQENVILADHCNYRIGGPARFFFEAKTAEDVRWAAGEAKKLGAKIFILGEGTNLLVSDSGFDGLVLRPDLDFIEADGEIVRLGAGASMEKLLDFAAESGLGGLEWAGGLPGTVGGAIYGNAGAFGGEIKDSVVEVQSFDLESGETRKRKNEECDFGYRTSIFKKRSGKEVVLSAIFWLKSGDPEEIRKAAAEKIAYRRERHPLEYPNIGSIFKNVPLENVPQNVREKCADVVKKDPFPVVPAARLIKLAGLKGKKHGGAMISEKHANFIVNTGGATASDVKYLIDLVKREIKEKFGIELEEEAQIV